MPTIDFDAFLAEQKQEPVLLKLGGKVFTLQASLPAPLALHLILLNKDRDPKTMVPPEEVEVVARGLLGDQYDEILTLVGGLDNSAELLSRLLGVYTPADPTNPNRAARRGKKRSASRS